jgi:hypothetical protein
MEDEPLEIVLKVIAVQDVYNNLAVSPHFIASD